MLSLFKLLTYCQAFVNMSKHMLLSNIWQFKVDDH